MESGSIDDSNIRRYPKSIITSFQFGNLVGLMMSQMYSQQLTFFYLSEVGLDIIFYVIGMVIYTLFNMFNDPLLGIVVSGIGTLKTCSMHYINHTDFPPSDSTYHLEKPLELLSVNGVIANGDPHLHIVVSSKENEMYGGHLEADSEVAYLAEIAILKTKFLPMNRHLDKDRKISLLGSL